MAFISGNPGAKEQKVSLSFLRSATGCRSQRETEGTKTTAGTLAWAGPNGVTYDIAPGTMPGITYPATTTLRRDQAIHGDRNFSEQYKTQPGYSLESFRSAGVAAANTPPNPRGSRSNGSNRHFKLPRLLLYAGTCSDKLGSNTEGSLFFCKPLMVSARLLYQRLLVA